MARTLLVKRNSVNTRRMARTTTAGVGPLSWPLDIPVTVQPFGDNTPKRPPALDCLLKNVLLASCAYGLTLLDWPFFSLYESTPASLVAWPRASLTNFRLDRETLALA